MPSGLSLIELVIAMGLSAVLITAIYSFFTYSTRSYRTAQLQLRMQREAAFALEEIANAVRGATALGPSGDVTTSLDVTTPLTTWHFTVTEGVLYKQEGSGTPVAVFDDADLRVSSLQFTKIINDDLADAEVLKGVSIDLALTLPPLILTPVTSTETVNLRSSMVSTPVPAQPTSTVAPTATAVVPATPTGLPTTLPTPTGIPTVAPTVAPTIPDTSGSLPTATVPLPTVAPTATAAPSTTAAPTATPTTCVLGVCL
jgi:prepilin-type N-terminal cleavage/methylation domain-containing protein